MKTIIPIQSDINVNESGINISVPISVLKSVGLSSKSKKINVFIGNGGIYLYKVKSSAPVSLVDLNLSSFISKKTSSKN